MAKKKSTELTLEEKLEQALVPVDEQPYEVPENWCWVKLEAVCKNMKVGGDKPKIYSDNWSNETTVPVIANGTSNDGVVGYTDKSSISEYAVTVAGRGTIGYSVVRRSEFYPIVRLIVLIPNECISVEYLKYVFDVLEEKGTGSSIPQLTVPMIKDKKLPLPPLAEQQRIVDRIESLFAKLDEAKDKVQSVLDESENRKAAILHKAFTGKLTEKWRDKNHVLLTDWKQEKFKDILDVRDGTHDSPQYYDEGYPLVTSKNLKNGTITDKDIKYISKEDYEQINLRSKVDIGDVLFAMIGTIGNPVVVVDEPNYAIKNMALFKNIGKINPFFLKYYLESKTVIDKMQKDAKGSTQKFVALGYLRNFLINLPTLEEQDEIVKELDTVIGCELELERSLDSLIEQSALLKKAVLAKALRGELSTNDSLEESSIGLLKKIL